MDLRITFDISDKLDAALGRLAIAIEAARACATSTAHSEVVGCPKKSVEIAPVTQPEPEQVITQPEPEIAKAEPVLAQSGAIESAANDDVEEPQKEPEPVKKPAKKKAVKKTEQAITQPEPEIVKSEPVLTPKPANVEEPPKIEEPPKVEEPEKVKDDGMAGMNLMEAARKLIEDIQDAGIEMADANARVRAKADELGLNFGSVTCLIKAIGYIEARKVALGK